MFTTGINELLSKPKVYHSYLVQIVFMVLKSFWVAHKDIVQLDVVERESGLMD